MAARSALAAVALVVVFTGACTGGVGSSGHSTEGASSGKTVVTYFTSPKETPELEDQARKQIEKFELQNPDIVVERETVRLEDERAVIQTRLRSDDPPDLFSYDTGPGFAGVLAKEGLLYDLTDAYEENDWPVYQWARQRVSFDGKLLGVPGNIDQLGVYYNKDVFDALGFGEPETLKELQEIAEAVKQEGMTPLAFGDREQWPAGHLFSMGVSNMLSAEGLDKILYQRGRWNDREVVQAIEVLFEDFVEAGYYPEDAATIGYEDANALFYSGQAAMRPNGTWLVPEVVENVDFEVGFFPFPRLDATGIHPPAGLGSGLFVAANAQEPDAAVALIDFLQFDAQEIEDGIEKFNAIPPFDVDTSQMDVSPLFRKVLDDFSEDSELGVLGYNIDVLTPQNFNTVMFEGFQEVLSGTRSPKEQADALQEAWVEAKAADDVLVKP